MASTDEEIEAALLELINAERRRTLLNWRSRAGPQLAQRLGTTIEVAIAQVQDFVSRQDEGDCNSGLWKITGPTQLSITASPHQLMVMHQHMLHNLTTSQGLSFFPSADLAALYGDVLGLTFTLHGNNESRHFLSDPTVGSMWTSARVMDGKKQQRVSLLKLLVTVEAAQAAVTGVAAHHQSVPEGMEQRTVRRSTVTTAMTRRQASAESEETADQDDDEQEDDDDDEESEDEESGVEEEEDIFFPPPCQPSEHRQYRHHEVGAEGASQLKEELLLSARSLFSTRGDGEHPPHRKSRRQTALCSFVIDTSSSDDDEQEDEEDATAEAMTAARDDDDIPSSSSSDSQEEEDQEEEEEEEEEEDFRHACNVDEIPSLSLPALRVAPTATLRLLSLVQEEESVLKSELALLFDGGNKPSDEEATPSATAAMKEESKNPSSSSSCARRDFEIQFRIAQRMKHIPRSDVGARRRALRYQLWERHQQHVKQATEIKEGENIEDENARPFASLPTLRQEAWKQRWGLYYPTSIVRECVQKLATQLSASHMMAVMDATVDRRCPELSSFPIFIRQKVMAVHASVPSWPTQRRLLQHMQHRLQADSAKALEVEMERKRSPKARPGKNHPDYQHCVLSVDSDTFEFSINPDDIDTVDELTSVLRAVSTFRRRAYFEFFGIAPPPSYGPVVIA